MVTLYLDTDAVLALIKDEDWLKAAAEEAVAGAERLVTSVATVLEARYVMTRKGYTDLVPEIEERMAKRGIEMVDLTAEQMVASRVLLDEHPGLGGFDAVHAATAQAMGLPIVSSDAAFGEIQGLDRHDLRA